jgi:ribosomal protein L3 glutamine methyltransferase
MTDQLLPVLQTVRDWLRFAVSRFEQAQLVYGHGTSSALDEAAFLVLSTLYLPIDQLEPFLDARLTMPERKAVADIIEARVVTRKPASYLTKCAWIGPYKFYCDERVIVPRSFLGELLVAGLPGVLAGDAPARVLDLCTGSGCLAIIAALQFPEAQVHASDASADALAVAARNIADYKLGGRLTLHEGDAFGALDADQMYDLIVCNPPYVTAAAVAAFPPEYQAEPVMAHDGGTDGMMLVHRILADAGAHLAASGTLVMEVGQGRATLERAYPKLPFLWLDTAASEGEVLALSADALRLLKSPKRPKARK